MRIGSFSTWLETSAPRLLGALFCSASLLAFTSCEKKDGTPDWEVRNGATSSLIHANIPDSPAPSTEGEEKPEPPDSEKDQSISTTPAAVGAGLRFISYNVENWLIMDRYVDGKSLKGAPKPEKEKQAVIALLTKHAPDVLGLCEIGQASDLAEIQEDLKAAGLDLPNLHYAGGSDPTRHLGILSRFPITSTAKPAESEYQLDGKTFAINRGILDATIQANGNPYRFVGVHLKSKRESEQGDQEAIRLHEARLLRRHLDSIMKADAAARIVVYGDFNDTRATPAIKAITGKYNDPTYLTAIPAKDSRNDAWTHYWALHDIYSRIDFIMVSPGMKKDVRFRDAKIIDDKGWEDASDHRAILAIFN